MKTEKNKITISTCMLAISLLLSLTAFLKAFALPEIDSIVSGSVDFVNTGSNTLSITATDKAIVNYKSFNINEGETVNISLPSATAEFLNRVTGGSISNILGTLTCNGIILLVNEAGIYFGPNSNIDVQGLIASTRDITDSDFLSSNYVFNRLSKEQLDLLLVNKGSINIRDGGFGVFIAGAVENQGIISARLGTIAMAGAEMVTLNMSSSGLISIAINKVQAGQVFDLTGNPITKQLNNTGTIQTPGGTVLLKAEALPDIFEMAINLDGYIKADSYNGKSGLVRSETTGIINIPGQIHATNIVLGTREILPEAVDSSLGTLSAAQAVEVAGRSLNITSISPLTYIYKPDDMLLSSSALDNPTSLVTLSGEGISVTYSKFNGLTLETSGTLNTTAGLIIQANSVKLIAQKFGTAGSPVHVDAENTYIQRLSGNIDILESTGLGTSILLRGPPQDSFGAIIYNSSKNLTLETLNGGINISENASIEANVLGLYATGAITSAGSIKVNVLNERGASFTLGGTCEVGSAGMINDDNAVTYNTGNYSGTYSDAVDIIISSNAVITLTGNTTFRADSDNNGSGAFIMNAGSSITGGYSLAIYASDASTLRSINGVSSLTVAAGQSGSNPTYTANNDLSVTNTTTISSCTLFMNSNDLYTGSIVNNGTLRGANYYVDSSGGNDSNTGTAPNKPWKTIAKVNSASFKPGDTVLFKRGGIWREQLSPDSGNSTGYITYSAYGTGDLPKILGSVSVSSTSNWTQIGTNIWQCNNSAINTDVGNLIFNNEGSVGFKKWSLTQLNAQGDFWYDLSTDKLKMYSSGNPGNYYSNIEAALTRNIISIQSYNIIENLDLRYSARMAIEGNGDSNIIIRNCYIAYIGGGDQYQDGRTVRLGNGIQFWSTTLNVLVEGNYLDNIYDAALTNQYNGTSTGIRQENIIYRNNIITNTEFSFELFNTSSGGTLTGIRIENNTSINAGGGWSHGQRSFKEGKHLRLGTLPGTYDVQIKNNIFYNTTNYFITYSVHNDITKYVLDYNCYGGSYDQFAKSGNQTYYSTFNVYKSTSHQDSNSLLTNPLLDADYKLTQNSPCRDNGTTLPGVTIDYAGTPRPFGAAFDIGAYEYTTAIIGPFTFTGTGLWSNTSLWSTGIVPGTDTIVIINGICTLTGNVSGIGSISINAGKSLNLAGYNIGTNDGITNNGTLYLLGNETITGNFTNNASSIVEYKGTGNYTGLKAGNNYYNLIFNSSGTWTLSNNLIVSSNITITNGTLNANAKTITVSGNWINNGTFNNNSGTVILNGTGLQQVKTNGSGSAFNILTINNTSTEGVTFTDALYTSVLNATGGVKKLSFATGSGVVHTITSSFNVAGSAGNLLVLAPATAGQVWYLNAPSCTVSYVNVSYSSQASGKTITARNSINGGNNTRWSFL